MDPITLTGLFLAALLFLIIAAIQIYYQKQTIKDLQKQLDLSEKTVIARDKKIKDLNWQIDNPPKFRKGNTFGELIIMSYEYYKPGLGHSIVSALSTLATALLFHKDKKYIDSLGEEFKKKTDPQYIYHCAHTETGEKVTRSELELTTYITPGSKE